MEIPSAGPLLLILLVLQVEAQEEIKYFEIGGSLVLDPKVSEPITSLTWKHNGNIQAEWIKDKVPLEYLGYFKGLSEVDLTTGVLTISNMLKADEGTFNMEINGRELPGRFRVVGVKNLQTVMVEVMTPTECTRASLNCTLECGGDFSDAGPVQYFWKKGDTGPWEENEKTITIPNTEEILCFKSFSCKVENPVSEKESNPAKSPFTRDPYRLNLWFSWLLGSFGRTKTPSAGCRCRDRENYEA
ncbi:uncharacterized protein LOC118557237 [Fundulus heteroclitus]|uniref:uncharacterized protein LOC118557237 n=1 Tax=Fundulus heteroclitus TaxID=8078 RepID=UPI00165B38A4|nr:uncharacterized protein LOC118557237 [Fundulus heteroclitus]